MYGGGGGGGGGMSLNVIIYSILEHACPEMLLFAAFWSMHVPKYNYLQHSGACMTQNVIYNILERACPQMLLFTTNNPLLELISGLSGLSGLSGNGVSSRRTDPPKPRAGVLG